MNALELPASALPLVLMSLAGPIGALDVVYFTSGSFACTRAQAPELKLSLISFEASRSPWAPTCSQPTASRGADFESSSQVGPGGKQIQIEDPDGNPIELFEPAAR